MVSFSTEDFPQADNLDTVGNVALAVASGARTDSEIEDAIGLNSDGRQGRYCRKPAEMLGLITNDRNHAELTDYGREYVATAESGREDFLALRVSSHPMLREALKFIDATSPTPNQLRAWVRSAYPGAASTADRRENTIRSWLLSAGLIGMDEGGLFVKRFIGTVALERPSPGVREAPLYPQVPQLVSYDVDQQKLERANLVHQKLVDAVSGRLFQLGQVPQQNGLIDLFVMGLSGSVLFEMKSIHQQNCVSQMRKAVAQLYEYRYLQQMPDAALCITTNYLADWPSAEYCDYLIRDRLIGVVQTEDFERLQAVEGTQDLSVLLGDLVA